MAALIFGLLARSTEGLGRDVLEQPRPHGVEGRGHHRPQAGRDTAHGRGTDATELPAAETPAFIH